MGLISNYRQRQQAIKAGKVALGEGIGFQKAPGSSGLLSQLASMLTPKWSEAPQRDIKDWLELYATSPRLDPVHKISQDVASAEWSLYKKLGDGEQEEVLEHPLLDLFNKPNPLPETSWYVLLYMTEAYLHISGEAFWVVERNGLTQISELWLLPSHWVTATPSLGKEHYEINTKDGVRMLIDKDDVVYFKEPNMLNPYGRGQGRVKAIGDEVETDEYMSSWAKNFFYNNATPPLVIEAPGAGPTDVTRIQESWLQKYAGLRNAHKPAVLPFAGKVHELGKTQKEMDFVESRKFLRDQANQHFRVPPELMGIIENSNRATIDAADYIYRSSVLQNRLQMIQQTVQNQIVDKFFESENLVFEFLDIVPDDKEFTLKASTEGLNIGAITVDEWRQKNGYDPLEGDMGAVFLIPAGVIPVRNPLDAAVSAMPTPSPTSPTSSGTPAPEPEPEVEEPQQRIQSRKRFKAPNWKAGYSDEEKDGIQTEFETTLDELEKPLAKKVEKFMREQGKRFAKVVEGAGIKEVLHIVETKDADDPSPEDLARAEATADDLIDSYDWIDDQGKLHEAMTDDLLAAAEAGTAFANDVFEMGISFSLIRDEMLEHISSHGFEKVVDITAETINLLKGTVVQGILEGEGSPALAKRIRQASEEYAYRRSFVIARTESHNTMVTGTFKTYVEAGIENKSWHTVMDGRQRSKHAKIRGQKRPIMEKFSNGLMYPGDPDGKAEEVIQCRCSLLPEDE